MIQGGLVSITFRQRSPRQVVDLVQRAGLKGIEWGGDIHVPHGQVALAKDVGAMTTDAGLQVAAYGSYYRAGISEQQGLGFMLVLDTAIALGAKIIRIWAGTSGSQQADAGCWSQVTEDIQRVADLAAAAKCGVALESHGGTLTDTAASAIMLHQRINRPNVRLYWQPAHAISEPSQISGLRQMLPHLSHVHVFHWTGDGIHHHRWPLANGLARWQTYFAALRSSAQDRFAMIEFVKDDSAEQFLTDAQTLKELLSEETGKS